MPGLDWLDTRLRESSELRETIGRSIAGYAVAMLGVFDEGGAEVLRLCGSGTLVRVADRHFILTAAHVWEALQASRQFGITVRENLDHRFLMETQSIPAFTAEKPANWGEWGPDLAYLLLPQGYIGPIQAHQCCFYNLTEQRQCGPDCDHIETWMLLGAPVALGNFTRMHANFYMVGHLSRIVEHHQRGGFDYIDLQADMALPDVPQDFRGVSGGGLWSVRIWVSSSEDKIEWLPSLQGVAFYQLAPIEGRRTIRCHGIESIRSTLPGL